MNKNQKGFRSFIILAIFVAIVLAGIGGWYVLNPRNNEWNTPEDPSQKYESYIGTVMHLNCDDTTNGVGCTEYTLKTSDGLYYGLTDSYKSPKLKRYVGKKVYIKGYL